MEHNEVDRAAWLAARAKLLAQEKAHTHARAALAAARRELPWVRLEKRYLFTGAAGEVDLEALFAGRSQLIVYHFMFGPGWDTPCPGCSSWASAFDGTTEQFAKADANLVAVSRGPYAQLAAEQERRGWRFTWVSSENSDFNYDFYASNEDTSEGSTKTIGGPDGEVVGFDRGENHGVSVFARTDDGSLFHTYSAYNRGIEALNGAFGYFDLLPKGRAW